MHWTLDKNRPICPQLCQQLCVRIVAGVYTPGQRIPSVRELALEAGVNPNTVQKTFEELERQKVLYSVRGAGWYVSEDIAPARQLRTSLVDQTMEEFFRQMTALGFSLEETKKMVKEWQL